MHDRQEEQREAVGGAEGDDVGGRTSGLERRLRALEGHQSQPEPISVLSLLNTEEIWRALALIERARVTPSGEVRNPQAFRGAPPEELAALEHWRELCGEPLDHLELAEELLDRVGGHRGWRSPQALEVALLLKRLELPNESAWYVDKQAEAVVALYAEMDEHEAGRGGGSLHPHVRAAVRRLERLEEIDRLSPKAGPTGPDPETEDGIEAEETAQRADESQEGMESQPNSESSQEVGERPSGATEEGELPTKPRRSWWKEFFRLGR